MIQPPVIDRVISTVGTPTLALFPAIIVLLVVSIILCGCIICMRVRHNEVSLTVDMMYLPIFTITLLVTIFFKQAVVYHNNAITRISIEIS